MAALPGGAADKLGNRYEAWWTLYRVADVLRGRASRMRLEPPAVEGEGVEFWVDQVDGRWYEQVKSGQRSWTMKRLIDQGVLLSVLGHLAGGHHVRFVLSAAASDLCSLSDRARATSSVDEYLGVITAEERTSFERLASAWRTPDMTAWQYLRNVSVDQQLEHYLRVLVHQTYELIVQGDPELVVNELRGWLDDMLHQTVTAPVVWEHLRRKGFSRRLLAGDPSTVEALAATADRHSRRVDGARPALGTVAQPQVQDLVKRLSMLSGPQVLVVHGKAGSGKSTAVAEAMAQLRSAGWHSAVVRMDAAAPSSHTAAGLGRAFELAGSPLVLLEGVADGSPAVLLVDQLDAVSTYSGRLPDSYDAVAELLEQATAAPNVKIVLVVRTVDLQADPRMRSLLANETKVAQLEIHDLALEDVCDALMQSGIDHTKLSSTTLDLLRVPLHLAVFSGLSNGAQLEPYRTLTDLYQRLTDETRLEVRRAVGHLDWTAVTATLVRFMSDKERLDAPVAVLDGADAAEVAALVSRGLLVADAGQYAFFHESYFDFLFARSFVATGGELHYFLVASRQQLFRRAQVRQVLDYLASTDRPAYRQTVVRLLTAGGVRIHLQEVAITSMTLLEATPGDWLAIEPLAFGDHPLHGRLANLLSMPRWFDAADEAGRWESLLSDPATVAVSAGQLIVAARHRAQRVVSLVRPYVGSSEEWRLRIRSLFEWSLTPGLVDLAVDLIERGELDDARSRFAVNSDFWSVIYLLREDDPDGAARLIGARLRRALAQAVGDGFTDPFEQGYLDPHSSSGGASTITEVAADAPQIFVAEVLPFVVSVADLTATGDDPGEFRSSPRWGMRHVDAPSSIDEAVFVGVEDALRLLAQDQPDLAIASVWPLAASEIEELRFLVCRTLSATDDADHADSAVDWLLSDSRNLRLGWIRSASWASRELIESASRRCSDRRLAALTSELMAYYPWWELGAGGRSERGRAQYDLLTGIESTRRSEAVARRIAEWERKFPTPPTPPQPIGMAGFVGPPVPQQAATHMNDEDWLRAIGKYRSNATIWTNEGGVGGARELARLLGSQAENEPERFAKLAMTFDADTPPEHLVHVIDAVAGKLPVSMLSELCVHARQVAGQSVGRALCRAVAAVATDADDALICLVEECAKDDDPSKEVARTATWSGQFLHGGDLTSAGLNSTRGAAARTVAALLFEQRDLADRLAPTVTALASDRILAVRTQAAEAVGALWNVLPGPAEAAAAKLFDAPVDIFEASTCCSLLEHMMSRDPDRFAPYLTRALEGSESVAQAAGWMWAVAFVRDVLVAPAPATLAALSSAARRGAAAAYATDPSAELDQLIALFQDEDPAVREAAAAAMRIVDELSTEAAERLVEAFIDSTAFADHFDDLVRALERSTNLLPEATIAAFELAVRVAGRDIGDIRTARAALSPTVIEVVLRLYRQGDNAMRTRCLNLIDELILSNAYGLEDALAGQR
jgi:hypothetical protein